MGKQWLCCICGVPLRKYDKFVKLNDGSYICSKCTIEAVKFYKRWNKKCGIEMYLTVRHLIEDHEKLEKFIRKLYGWMNE